MAETNKTVKGRAAHAITIENPFTMQKRRNYFLFSSTVILNYWYLLPQQRMQRDKGRSFMGH